MVVPLFSVLMFKFIIGDWSLYIICPLVSGVGFLSLTIYSLLPLLETVNHKPVIHRIQNDTITRGSNYTVNCTAVSSAHNHVQWYKGFCYDDCSNKTSINNVVQMKVLLSGGLSRFLCSFCF